MLKATVGPFSQLGNSYKDIRVCLPDRSMVFITVRNPSLESKCNRQHNELNNLSAFQHFQVEHCRYNNSSLHFHMFGSMEGNLPTFRSRQQTHSGELPSTLFWKIKV